MDLEDVAEKARRNLMVVSTGILAVWGLGIPLDGKLVGAVDLSAVEPWRAWAAVSCVLIYFAARYYLSPATIKQWSPWRQRRRRSLATKLGKALDSAFSQDKNATVNVVTLKWQDHRGIDALNLRMTLPQHNIRRRGNFSYVYLVDYKYGKPEHLRRLEDIKIPADQLEGGFEFSRRFYGICQWSAFRDAYKPTWDLLELSFPWFLAFGALAVCIWRLAISFYYSYPFVRQLLPV